MSRLAGTLAAVCLTAAACVPPAAAAPGAPARTPTSAPTGTSTATHAVPPPAPAPTASGRSPMAPDPHPPAGGVGPSGEHVGGTALATRGRVVPAGAPALPADLTGRAWMVADLDTGAVLAARDPHGRYQPASIQKLLTTLTLLPVLPGGQRLTVTRSAALTEGSRAGLVPDGTYTVDQLFRGLLLVSGNDCAEALAQAAGGRAHTVAMMNATARGLGAYDTLVQTPSGLDGWQQLTSSYDMMLVLRAALAQPRFLAYDTVQHASLPAQHTDGAGAVPMWNQNVQFLTTVKGALAAKTGYTDAAQHTFAGAIERHGHRYGVVLMRAQRWPDDQWVQATRLVAWASRLPTGTAPVGRLVRRAAAPRVDAASAGPGSGAGSSPGGPSSSAPGGKGSGSTGGVRILIVVLLFGGVMYLATRIRRRPPDLRPPGGGAGPGPR